MEWRQIKGYEGLYEISEKGDVRRLCRKFKNGKLLKPQLDSDGYLRICLSKDNKKKTYIVHRLVAEAFIPNPMGHPVINHIDEVKTNNDFRNLEWCTVKYNTAYNDGIERRAVKRRIPIIAHKDGETRIFASIKEASEELDVNRTNIIGCLKNAYGRKTCKGITFEYLEKG